MNSLPRRTFLASASAALGSVLAGASSSAAGEGGSTSGITISASAGTSRSSPSSIAGMTIMKMMSSTSTTSTSGVTFMCGLGRARLPFRLRLAMMLIGSLNAGANQAAGTARMADFGASSAVCFTGALEPASSWSTSSLPALARPASYVAMRPLSQLNASTAGMATKRP